VDKAAMQERRGKQPPPLAFDDEVPIEGAERDQGADGGVEKAARGSGAE